jgi:hypothetical protein
MRNRFWCLLILFPLGAYAGEVTIVDVRVECPSTCTFAVTLEHADEGWNHYADQWDVVTLDDRLLKSRVLYHPHENEQPFTRSLSGVLVPQAMKQVKIRARDSLHGYSPREFVVDLPGRD